MQSLLNATAGTYMGATYPTPYAHHFDPNAGALLQASYAAGPHATPTGTTYYATPPFFYWPYSSPPVSPNTCYSHQSVHNAATPMPAAAYHQTMYSLDLISAQINFATPTSATAMSPPSLAPQSVQPPPPAAAGIKPHTVSPCTETYMTPTPQPPPPKAQIMTLLQFKQFSTPTVAPTVIPIANIKPTTTTTTSSSSYIQAECESVLPQTNQKQNAQNQQSQNINVQNSHNDAVPTTSFAISSNNSSYTSVSEYDQSSEDCCNSLLTKNDMLSLDTTDAPPSPPPHASVTVATTLNTSQTTFSMVAKPHLTSITGRTKPNVHKVC